MAEIDYAVCSKLGPLQRYFCDQKRNALEKFHFCYEACHLHLYMKSASNSQQLSKLVVFKELVTF